MRVNTPTTVMNCEASATTSAPTVTPAARAVLERTAAEVLRHKDAGTFPLAPGIMQLDASVYACPTRFEREKARIFRRFPQMLALSCELPNAGDYKTLDVAGIPVLIVRGRDGTARAFLNSCTHRGAAVAAGCGSAARFTCPYHGWTFGRDGALLAVNSAEDFGAVDKATNGLKQFPTTERAGFIWAILDPETALDPAGLLSGIDTLLAGFGLENWTCVESRALPGPNWKLAFDAHLEFYHLPVLHRETFGPDRSNQALYFFHGPHQRLLTPIPRPGTPATDDLHGLGRLPTGAEPINPLMTGEWILFPGTSVNLFFPGGHRGLFISQVFPGETVGQSVTIQTYVSETPPDDDTRAEIARLCDFLARVVGTEDIPTSFHQQKVMASGLMPQVQFGRNEGGLQHFHRWVEKLTDADDADLPELLGGGITLAF